MYKLKKSFEINVTGLDNVQVSIKNNEITFTIDIIIKNKLMPDISIKGVDLDIWINENYLGHVSSNKKVTSQNEKIILPVTFVSQDLGLATALAIEREKFIQIAGKVKLIKPIPLSININHYGKF